MSLGPGAAITPGGYSVNTAQSKTCALNMNQAAATYTLATATGGDVWVEVIGSHVKTAAAGLTSAQWLTDHTTPKAITGLAVLASLTLDAVIVITVPFFLLQSGKRIQNQIIGTGSGGEWDLMIRWSPATPGATLL